MLNKIKSLFFFITLIAFLFSATAGFAYKVQGTSADSKGLILMNDDKDDKDDEDKDDDDKEKH